MGSRNRSLGSWAAALAAVCFVLQLAACSVSDSVKSSSDIISSPITSLSKSSSPNDAYKNDVRDFTAAYLKSGGDPSQLEAAISAVAEKRGISDWEKNQSTYEGIGAGLAKAGASEAELEAYKRTIADNDEQAAWMQKGYDSYE